MITIANWYYKQEKDGKPFNSPVTSTIGKEAQVHLQ